MPYWCLLVLIVAALAFIHNLLVLYDAVLVLILVRYWCLLVFHYCLLDLVAYCLLDLVAHYCLIGAYWCLIGAYWCSLVLIDAY